MVEHLPVKEGVIGSNPICGAISVCRKAANPRALGVRDRWFKSSHADHNLIYCSGNMEALDAPVLSSILSILTIWRLSSKVEH